MTILEQPPVTEEVPSPATATASPSPPTMARVSTGSRGSGLLSAVERATGITPSGITLIGIAGVALLLSRVLASRGMALLAYGLLMVLGLSWTLGRRKLAIEAARSELPSRVPAKRII